MKKKQIIREHFSNKVFARDKNKCVFCNTTKELDAHHITDRSKMPNGGYVEENGITLCQVHHWAAEQYHISNGERWEKGMHPFDLYKKIGSSYELAVEKSS